MNNIKLTDITSENWEQVCYLNPGKEGREFVASNAYSLAQHAYDKWGEVKRIELDGALIGFTMYGYEEDLNGYELCRFMIDQKYQCKGYGKQALKLIVDTMFDTYKCDKVYLSTSPDNERGKHVYTSFGFKATGESCGDDDDIEDIYVYYK